MFDLLTALLLLSSCSLGCACEGISSSSQSYPTDRSRSEANDASSVNSFDAQEQSIPPHHQTNSQQAGQHITQVSDDQTTYFKPCTLNAHASAPVHVPHVPVSHEAVHATESVGSLEEVASSCSGQQQGEEQEAYTPHEVMDESTRVEQEQGRNADLPTFLEEATAMRKAAVEQAEAAAAEVATVVAAERPSATDKPAPLHGDDEDISFGPIPACDALLKTALASPPAAPPNIPQGGATDWELSVDDDADDADRRIDLASSFDGGSVLASNKEAKHPGRAIDSDVDSFMMNVCGAVKWMILELSQLGRVDELELTMKEMYSSRVKDFTIKGRQSHPKRDGIEFARSLESDTWQLLGVFSADNKKGSQVFRMQQRVRVRYLLLQFHTHFGSEAICALNRVRVWGVSAAQELEQALARQLDMEGIDGIDAAHTPPTLASSGAQAHEPVLGGTLQTSEDTAAADAAVLPHDAIPASLSGAAASPVEESNLVPAAAAAVAGDSFATGGGIPVPPASPTGSSTSNETGSATLAAPQRPAAASSAGDGGSQALPDSTTQAAVESMPIHRVGVGEAEGKPIQGVGSEGSGISSHTLVTIVAASGLDTQLVVEEAEATKQQSKVPDSSWMLLSFPPHPPRTGQEAMASGLRTPASTAASASDAGSASPTAPSSQDTGICASLTEASRSAFDAAQGMASMRDTAVCQPAEAVSPPSYAHSASSSAAASSPSSAADSSPPPFASGTKFQSSAKGAAPQSSVGDAGPEPTAEADAMQTHLQAPCPQPHTTQAASHADVGRPDTLVRLKQSRLNHLRLFPTFPCLLCNKSDKQRVVAEQGSLSEPKCDVFMEAWRCGHSSLLPLDGPPLSPMQCDALRRPHTQLWGKHMDMGHAPYDHGGQTDCIGLGLSTQHYSDVLMEELDHAHAMAASNHSGSCSCPMLPPFAAARSKRSRGNGNALSSVLIRVKHSNVTVVVDNTSNVTVIREEVANGEGGHVVGIAQSSGNIEIGCANDQCTAFVGGPVVGMASQNANQLPLGSQPFCRSGENSDSDSQSNCKYEDNPPPVSQPTCGSEDELPLGSEDSRHLGPHPTCVSEQQFPSNSSAGEKTELHFPPDIPAEEKTRQQFTPDLVGAKALRPLQEDPMPSRLSKPGPLHLPPLVPDPLFSGSGPATPHISEPIFMPPLEGSVIVLAEGGSASKGASKGAGNLFDVFKQEFMMLKLNQSKLARYISQLVDVVNQNAGNAAKEVAQLEHVVSDLQKRVVACAIRQELLEGNTRQLVYAAQQEQVHVWSEQFELMRQDLDGFRVRELALLLYCSAMLGVVICTLLSFGCGDSKTFVAPPPSPLAGRLRFQHSGLAADTGHTADSGHTAGSWQWPHSRSSGEPPSSDRFNIDSENVDDVSSSGAGTETVVVTSCSEHGHRRVAVVHGDKCGRRSNPVRWIRWIIMLLSIFNGLVGLALHFPPVRELMQGAIKGAALLLEHTLQRFTK